MGQLATRQPLALPTIPVGVPHLGAGAKRSMRLTDVLGPGMSALSALLLFAVSARAQSIAGRISGADGGQAIAAAQVSLPELSLGVLSEGDGRYLIEHVPVGTYTVSVQRLGYRPAAQVVEVWEGEAIQLDFELPSRALSLDAVFVTGTVGGSPVRAIGSLAERISVPNLSSSAPVSTVEDVLTGRMPGVMLIGTPNSAGDGAQIRIRGSPSIGLIRDPLIYVDGVRMVSERSFVERYAAASRLNDIELMDIESIEVIKGPAAATLYGTGASNGVIQILTKRGQLGGPVFDISTETGTLWLPERYVTNGWVADPDLCPSLPCANVDQLISTNLVIINQELGFGDVFTHGLTQRYHLAVRGGTEWLRYSASLSSRDQDGVVDWNWDTGSSARGSLQITVSETFSITLSGAYHKTELGPPQNFWASNFAWGGSPNTILNGHPNRGFRTLPEAFDPSVHTEVFTTKRSSWSVELAHQTTGWLTHRLIAGVDQIDERFNEMDNSPEPGGTVSRSDVRTRALPMMTADFSGSATFRFGDRALGSLSSYGIQYSHSEDLSRSATSEIILPSTSSAIPGEPITDTQRAFLEGKTLGVYVQQQFDWKDRVFLTGAVRRDDNSALGTDLGNAFYPRIMAAWVVHEESFWGVDWVSQLRLRGGWGTSGLQPDAFAALRLPRAGTLFGQQPILTPFSSEDSDLRLERSDELELGFDAEFWDGRASASFTYFGRSTTDAILARPNAPSLGTSGVQLANLGELKAQGTETSVEVRALRRQPIWWDLRVAFTTLGTKIVELGEIERIQVGRSRAHYEGFPLAALSDKRILSAEFANGVNGAVENVLCDGGSGRHGLELGGTPVPCDDAPQLVWGRTEPSWMVNLTSTWTLFHDWRLTANIDAQGGHWMSSDYLGARHTSFLTSRLAFLVDSPIGQAYRQVTRNGLAFHRAGFAKLRELSLAYQLPAGVTDRVGATSGNLTVGLRNVATLWLAQRFLEGERITDPEMSRPDGNFAGESGGDWPPLSSWSVRMNLTF